MKTFFVTGIDTDAGKSVITGLLSRFLLKSELNVITAKLAQTGCTDIAEDIVTHRRLEGRGLLDIDREHRTCPYLFNFPCSPHLAAEMEEREINPQKITDCIKTLERQYDCVLVEGAGGFFVPLTRSLMTADYAAGCKWPVIIVSSGRLGSINHTILTIEAIRQRKMRIAGVVYNSYPVEKPEISSDSKWVIVKWLRDHNINAPLIEAPLVEDFDNPPDTDFSPIFRGIV
ncbi:MAG: ATP-dependent dethiobiotin synthetase BioD [Lentisphaerae bacterium]|nr:ATP-dependent dethiobiotin synthetase BioD [Lentisphaerota bacterium]MCP4102438.1 ATP-dependent dethiobiotin synthetase BioD [Lentisphaerota bacterium]